MAQHDSYWSCSRFADWLRGTKKPFALGWEEWDDWTEAAQATHPWRYWLADVALGKLQDIVYSPKTLWRSVNAYIDNRFVTQTHYLKTDLPVGRWYDFDQRVLHGLFNELVLYVEMELAGMERCCNRGGKGPRRSKEMGLAYLEWEMSLTWGKDEGLKPGDKDYGKATHQAVVAKETFALYDWWLNKRPNRPDPFDSMNEDEEGYHARYGEVDKITEQYEREDNAMLVRLILNRRSMWT